ncbi:MAG: DUF4917 family protein [Phenylobacterium sp.]|uniref:DUF4917 family protein n=1 Tax=Phenylobacterium sp. TaxID=1871053 RepID=UPI001A289522|nr:DUF4917 family protein [Phenylobacterium sp.]MBJ7408891.1 DUF4917 family protein [Phenylobacterium sp.]
MHSIEERTFEEVLDLTKDLERDLLLGNGFSIAAHGAFNYAQLLDRVSVSDDVRAIFATARTPNFEAVMRVLLAEMQGMNDRERADAKAKIDALKRALIQSVHEVHPPRRNAISVTEWDHCVNFLEHFIGRKRKGRILTTNYDLLLSWAVAPDRDIGKNRRLNAYEGFRGGPYGGLGGATIIYLHGALHLYMNNGWPQQMQYLNTGVPLHDHIAARLSQNQFPIIVTEGAAALKKPTGPGFLQDAFTAFRGTCKGGQKKALFTLGHGLGPEDRHLLELIPKGTVQTICLGAFGSADREAFREIAKGWIATRAKDGKPLKVYIFGSEGVVWGPKARPATAS